MPTSLNHLDKGHLQIHFLTAASVLGSWLASSCPVGSRLSIQMSSSAPTQHVQSRAKHSVPARDFLFFLMTSPPSLWFQLRTSASPVLSHALSHPLDQVADCISYIRLLTAAHRYCLWWRDVVAAYEFQSHRPRFKSQVCCLLYVWMWAFNLICLILICKMLTNNIYLIRLIMSSVG